MIVDAHVHLLPERLASKIRRFFEDRGAPVMPYPYAPRAARECLVAAGIVRCWSLPYAHRAGVAGPLNRWMAQNWAGDPLVVRFAPDDDRLGPLWDRVSESNHPVVVHAGSAAEGTATSADVDAVGRTALRWPGARIIVAHFGSPSVDKTLDLLRHASNVYADLCPVVADPVLLSRSAIAGFERRILFGSDTPSVAVSIEDSIEQVRGWKLDPDDEAAVLGGTADLLLAGVKLPEH